MHVCVYIGPQRIEQQYSVKTKWEKIEFFLKTNLNVRANEFEVSKGFCRARKLRRICEVQFSDFNHDIGFFWAQ